MITSMVIQSAGPTRNPVIMFDSSITLLFLCSHHLLTHTYTLFNPCTKHVGCSSNINIKLGNSFPCPLPPPVLSKQPPLYLWSVALTPLQNILHTYSLPPLQTILQGQLDWSSWNETHHPSSKPFPLTSSCVQEEATKYYQGPASLSTWSGLFSSFPKVIFHSYFSSPPPLPHCAHTLYE